jgi:hypothetical protein
MLPRYQRGKQPRAPIPHYVPGIKWPVAQTDAEGHLLYKSILDIHILTDPRAIGFDVAILDESQQLGATDICVTHRERGTVYTCTIETFRKRGFPVRRGHGEQWALPLDWFSIDGEPPRAEVKRQEQAGKQDNSGQLTLFTFAEPRKGA